MKKLMIAGAMLALCLVCLALGYWYSTLSAYTARTAATATAPALLAAEVVIPTDTPQPTATSQAVLSVPPETGVPLPFPYLLGGGALVGVMLIGGGIVLRRQARRSTRSGARGADAP